MDKAKSGVTVINMIVFIALLFVASLVLSGVVALLIWLFGGNVGFRPIFWGIFSISAGLYLLLCLIYKSFFETWVNEHNSNIRMGMTPEAAIKKAYEKSRIRPPLKIAQQVAKNIMYLRGR